MTNHTGTDSAITDDWGIEDEDPLEPVRVALADVQRQVHDLSLSLLNADWEARMTAIYTLTDLAETMTSLRFRLEFNA